MQLTIRGRSLLYPEKCNPIANLVAPVGPGWTRAIWEEDRIGLAIWIDSEAGKAKNNEGIQSQCSSVVEQRFRKPSVAGSIPAIGSSFATPLDKFPPARHLRDNGI